MTVAYIGIRKGFGKHLVFTVPNTSMTQPQICQYHSCYVWQTFSKICWVGTEEFHLADQYIQVGRVSDSDLSFEGLKSVS